MQAMLQVAPTVTLDEVHAFARSFFSFVADYSRENSAAADSEANPDKYCSLGPIRTTSIIACVPTFVTKTGEAIEGGISARAGPSISTSGHLDGTNIDMDAVQQPGVDDSTGDVMQPPEGSVKYVFFCIFFVEFSAALNAWGLGSVTGCCVYSLK